MNYGPLIFLGLLFTMTVSWYGIIYKNYLEVGRLEPVKNELTGATFPAGRSGLAQTGIEVYRANNCAACHTMQVRVSQIIANPDALKPGVQTNFSYAGPDIARGWGSRPTSLQDFVYDQAVFPGQVRIGPDLASVGNRLPDLNWHLLHFYNPRVTVPESTMPPYPFLFEKRKTRGTPSASALKITGQYAPPAGYEIVPTRDAIALATYMVSLRSDLGGPFTPVPSVVTNKVEAPTESTPAGAGNVK